MRLQLGIVALLASGLSLVAARATTAGLYARTTTDVCGDVSDELIIPGLFGTKIPIGRIDKCICESQIPNLLKTDPLLRTAAIIAGDTTVMKELTDLLNKSKDHQKCEYPDNSEAVCAKGTPCGFKCKNGFTDKHPAECVCKPPHTVCNGVCGSFKACPSHKPWRRDVSRRKGLCDFGMTACGIYGRAGDAWECLDASTDLESCGGCTIPLDAFSPHGVDCTAIPGVVDVSCRAGSCAVHRCAPGFTVSDDGTFCVASGAMREQIAGLGI